MGLTLVSNEDLEKDLKKTLAEAEAQLTDADREAIQENFKVQNFYKSEEQYIHLFTFSIIGNKPMTKLVNKICKIGLANYNKKSGCSIYPIPSWYISK